MRINGILKEWDNSTETIGKFSNQKFLEDQNGDSEEKDNAWIVSQDGSYIYTKASALDNVSYYAELSIGVQLVRKGKVFVFKNNFIDNL